MCDQTISIEPQGTPQPYYRKVSVMEIAKTMNAFELNKQGATVTLLEVHAEPSPDTKPESPQIVMFQPQSDSGNERGLQPPATQSQKILSRRELEGFSLEGKTCVVTGGASGIGLEVCRSIMIRGGNVAIVDLNGNHLASFSFSIEIVF